MWSASWVIIARGTLKNSSRVISVKTMKILGRFVTRGGTRRRFYLRIRQQRPESMLIDFFFCCTPKADARASKQIHFSLAAQKALRSLLLLQSTPAVKRVRCAVNLRAESRMSDKKASRTLISWRETTFQPKSYLAAKPPNWFREARSNVIMKKEA